MCVSIAAVVRRWTIVRIRRGRVNTSYELRETRWENPQKHHVKFGWLAWTTFMVNLIKPEKPLFFPGLDKLHGQSKQAVHRGMVERVESDLGFLEHRSPKPAARVLVHSTT
jgi:hypothetical protein